MIEHLAIGLAIGLAAAWLMLIVGLTVAGRGRVGVGGSLQLMADTLRLLKDLVGDRSLPRGVRWRVGAAMAYAGQPFGLIPDWIPVVGYTDNVAAICWALRSVVRVSGPAAVEAHWKGTPDSLAYLYRLLRLPAGVSAPGPTAAPGIPGKTACSPGT